MSLDLLLGSVSEHQRRIVQALLDNPGGLLSHELAEITGVSNKSETMKPHLRNWLKRCGKKLIIEREKNCFRWSLKPYAEPLTNTEGSNKLEKIEIDGARIQQLMNNMEPEARYVFERLLLQVSSQAPIKRIEKWLSEFESDCPVDNLIARIVCETIDKVGANVWFAMKKSKESGAENFSGHEAAKIAIREVRGIVDTLEKHLEHDACASCADTDKPH